MLAVEFVDIRSLGVVAQLCVEDNDLRNTHTWRYRSVHNGATAQTLDVRRVHSGAVNK